MRRSHVLIFLWALALALPLLNICMAMANDVASNYRLVAFNSPLDIGELVASIVCTFILPAAPFAVLALLTQQKGLDLQPTFGLGAIVGAAACAVFGVVGGWSLIWLLVWLSGDGGASLGYWGIICSLPLFVPMLMIMGWTLGSRFDASAR